MPLNTKMGSNPIEPNDGLRILVCRFRPRADRGRATPDRTLDTLLNDH